MCAVDVDIPSRFYNTFCRHETIINRKSAVKSMQRLIYWWDINSNCAMFCVDLSMDDFYVHESDDVYITFSRGVHRRLSTARRYPELYYTS